MNSELSTIKKPLVRPFPLWFLGGLILVNAIAIFQFDPLYVGAFFSFIYIVLAPGLLLLPFLVKKQLTLPLGIAFGVGLSILLLMLTGLVVNTALPLLHIGQPLTTLPLLLAFDVLIYILLGANFFLHRPMPMQIPTLNASGWAVSLLAILIPTTGVMGAIQLNNGGGDLFSMLSYGLCFVLLLALVLTVKDLHPTIPALSLYCMALSFLLMNSMRGWFVTGHDILLEYHVFTLTNNAHIWSMSLYRDPYMACLSLTILPTYLQNLIHVPNAYIFKFFFQFIGALTVLPVYALCKDYSTKMVAFLGAFLYISFPTFMTDMAFLNRQGIALLFFALTVVVLLFRDRFYGKSRTVLLFLLGTGMVLSHYSTSYVAVAILAGAYVINYVIRFFMNLQRPRCFSRITDRFGNKDEYRRPILLTLPFIIGLLGIIVLWSGVITKTSANISTTLVQIVNNISAPFSSEQHAGVDQYSLVKLAQATPQTLFGRFINDSISNAQTTVGQSNLFPPTLVAQYPVSLVNEPLLPLTALGSRLGTILHANWTSFYSSIKQLYAYIMQILLIIGLIGIGVGYGFKKGLLNKVPSEFIGLSIAGIMVLVGQTLLPSTAIDYGLLRLFQQNLIFLSLPIILGLFAVLSLVIWNEKLRLVACAVILVAFFAILSGFIPQLTGGGRPALTLNNEGFYYDAYYLHSQEVGSIDWLAENRDPRLPVQSDLYFSTVKILSYGNIVTTPGLLPQTIQKNSYVYLNYNNTKTGNVIEYINGSVVYYHFPLNFLSDNKNLIYNDGGSEIYQ